METIQPAQWALLGSLIAYPIAYLVSIPSRPSPLRIAQSREAISILHCALQTVLAGVCLRRHADSWTTEVGTASRYAVDSDVPIITTKSTFANCITAVEAGYLLQDSFVLLHAFRARSEIAVSTLDARQARGYNFLHLGLHHTGMSTVLLVLQYYIAKGHEKGILVIVALHLMNASSIFGTARWFLTKLRPNSTRLILAVTAMYLSAFAVFRVYLIYWIMDIFGKQQGLSAWAAIARLRIPCKVGTWTITLINTIWLLTGIKNLAVRLVG